MSDCCALYNRCDKVLSIVLAYFSMFTFAVFVYLLNVNMPIAFLVYFGNLAVIYVSWAYTYNEKCKVVCEKNK